MLRLHLTNLICVLGNDLKFLYYIIGAGVGWATGTELWPPYYYCSRSTPLSPHCHRGECPPSSKIGTTEVSTEEQGWQICGCPRDFRMSWANSMMRFQWYYAPKWNTLLCHWLSLVGRYLTWFLSKWKFFSLSPGCGVCVCSVSWTNSLKVVTNGKKQWQIA